MIEIRKATLDGDQAADERAEHDGVKYRDRRQVHEDTNEEPPPGRRCRCIFSEQDYRDRGHACQECEGHPQKPVYAAEGHRLSHAHVGQDEDRDDEKTRLAEG